MDEPTITRPGICVPVRIDPKGRRGPTPGQARGRRWDRVGPGFYVPSDVDHHQVEQRIVEAMAGAPPDAAVTGWAAHAWLGGRWFSGLAADGRTPLPVPVNLGALRGMRPREGVTWVEDWLFGDDVIEIDGLRVTVPVRSTTFEVRRARSAARAIQFVDMTAAADLASVEELRAYRVRIAGRPGVAQLDLALDWADENVWSPQETPMRIEWREARPNATLLTNPPIFSLDGRHLMTPDLLDPDAGVAGEYNGAVHLGGELRRTDLGRDDLYRQLAIEPVAMMSSAHDDVAAFHTRLRHAYQRSEGAPSRPRLWTLEQPDWWVDTSTVAKRRALSEEQRTRWLRRQIG